MPDFSHWGPVTVVLVALTVIAGVCGAVVVVTHPETLSFEQLLNDLEKFAIALGLLGVGRGIHAAGRATADAQIAVPPGDGAKHQGT